MSKPPVLINQEGNTKINPSEALAQMFPKVHKLGI